MGFVLRVQLVTVQRCHDWRLAGPEPPNQRYIVIIRPHRQFGLIGKYKLRQL
ncbi:hypothetical protein K239x_12270 [Planctomycetes bacterium K23_9]|uniref:Uncharacterized protein n=1 Tax=Stieleria marina TaxID=1930275 RepID=A0A517NQ90_9BACT|nr:hypothetical protein K239x_12270 [Planctomycetes bacterium K23_9]